MRPGHDAVVADLCRLWQARCPGRIDVECRIVQGRAAARGGIERRSRQICHGAIDVISLPGQRRSMRPDSRLALKAGTCIGQRGKVAGRRDNGLGPGGVDAMRERGSLKVRVDERGDAADARQTQPDRHIFLAVGHQEADAIAFLEALLQSPPGVTVCQRRSGPVAQIAFVRKEGGGIAEALCQLVHYRGEGAIWRFCDGRGCLKRPYPSACCRLRSVFAAWREGAGPRGRCQSFMHRCLCPRGVRLYWRSDCGLW